MSKTIVQDVLFINTTAKELYDLYIDGDKHSIATGATAVITATEGSTYSAHNGHITGKNLLLIPNRLIVQTWRAKNWASNDIDSTFTIYLETQGADVLLHAVHANVPDTAYDDLDAGWRKMYWEPWRLYLAGTPIPRAAI